MDAVEHHSKPRPEGRLDQLTQDRAAMLEFEMAVHARDVAQSDRAASDNREGVLRISIMAKFAAMLRYLGKAAVTLLVEQGERRAQFLGEIASSSGRA